MALAALALAAPSLRAQERISVRSEPGTPTVAVEVRIAVGPADEPAESAGLAHLTARAAALPIRPTLDSLGARLEVTSYKDAVAFGVTAAPEVWKEAVRTLLVSLFRDPADPAAVVSEREAIRGELLARASNPADALLREADAAVFGDGHPWGRPTVGTAATLDGIGAAEVDGFLRTFFVPGRAVVAAVGPVDADEARAHLLASFPATEWRPPVTEPTQPAPSPVTRDYNSITSWVSASYPVPPTADAEALRLLADVVLERIGFAPNRHSVYNARAELIRRAGGGELRVQMVVPPAEASLWTERIQDAVEAFATPLPRAAFEQALRRFRGQRLLQLAAPEERAAADAEALLTTGHPADVAARLNGLSPQRLADAAAALPAPVVVVLGPLANQAD